MNTFNFACGGFDSSNNPLLYGQRYSYSFSGLPSWLRQSGSTISGMAPANFGGSININVRYTAPGSGFGQSPFTAFTLVPSGSGSGFGSGSASSNYYLLLNSILNGNSLSSSSAGNAVVFFPFRTGLRAGSGGYVAVIRVSGGGSSGGQSTVQVYTNANAFAFIQQCVSLQNAYYQAQQAYVRAEQNRLAIQAQLNAAMIKWQLIQRSLADSIQAANKYLQDQLAAIKRQIDTLQGQLQAAQADSQAKGQAVAQAQSELDAAQKALTDATNNQNAAAQAKQNLDAAQAKYNQAQQGTQAANQNLDAARQKASESASKAQALNQAASNAKAKIDELQQQLKQAQADLDNANNQIAALNQNGGQGGVDQAQQAVTQAQQVETQAKADLDSATTAYNQAAAAGDTSAATAAVNAAQTKLKQAQDIAADSQKILATLQGQINTLTSQYQTLSG